MALSDKECVILKELFKYLPDDDLMSMAQTVTQNRLVFSSREDATEAILSFSPSTESILKRKKVKTEYLVKFMFDCGIPLQEKIEKPTVIKRFLDNLPTKSLPKPVKELSPSPPPPPSNSVSSNSGPSNPGASNFGAAFAAQFTPWFVRTFNAGPPDLGPQHFWSDVAFRLRAVAQDTASSSHVEVQGASEVSSQLAALFGAGVRLVAAPEALGEAEVDDFGRVSLRFKGVVHRAAPCGSDGGPAGLFQVALGLMEGVPSQELSAQLDQRSYKIKFLQLDLQTSISLDPRAICS